jgi:hypothetical protein
MRQRGVAAGAEFPDFRVTRSEDGCKLQAAIGARAGRFSGCGGGIHFSLGVDSDRSTR